MRWSPRRRRFLALVVLLAAAILLPFATRSLVPRFQRPAPLERTAPWPSASSPVDRATCAGPGPAAANAAFEQRVVELLNAERRAAGLPPLKLVEPLTAAARWFAREMAVRGYFAPDHDTYDNTQGRLVRVCDWSARVSWFYASTTNLGETIAAGYETPQQVVAGWMRSPGHRAEVLGPGYWETGAGYWTGGPQGSYWVADFGRRDGSFPVVIDEEAVSTRAPQVRLHVYGGWREMRVRNDDGVFSPWRPFASDLDWTLDDVDGTRTVSVELRDGPRTAASSDTIRLDRSATAERDPNGEDAAGSGR